jgi:tetratricopeptide (TPR) repeat protein
MFTRWPARNKNALVLLLIAGASILLLTYWRRTSQSAPITAERASSPSQPPATAYADPSTCASCHEEIARTYNLTGMARAFSKASGSTRKASGRVYHEASDRYYAIVERDGKIFQRRHQIGFDGKEANALELEAHYVIGSGNHAQTFLHRNADGQLVQMPVTWYAERGVRLRGATTVASARQGYWAMSPGYDRAAHLDFRRPIDAGCMSCHNAYPRKVFEEGSAPGFGEPLPEGIDCQRCHGPGQAHVDAIKANDLAAARRAIVNPATLSRERQLDVCMQCHLESTSSPLPFQIPRFEHPWFSYTPGQPLSDYFIHFDHAPGAPGRDDKFEIAGAAYRLRKSACFQRSEMTCVTCHDPHDVARGSEAVVRYVAACQSCHETPHRAGIPRVSGTRGGATCLDCHMPKRRTEDAVHVVMTDHYIRRRQPRSNLLADLTEADIRKLGEYRGEVALYYPATLPSTPDNELYLAVAQVRQGSNLVAGIPRLEQAIAKYRPARPEFYYELARAYSMTADYDAGIRWCREALQRDAAFVPALKELGAAATAKGDLTEAAGALERAVALRPGDGNAVADLGGVYLRQGRIDDAQQTLQRALALDATLPQANNMMGLAALRKGAADTAEMHFREAIRLQPDLAEAHNNLGNLLAGRRAYAEAGYHFEHALRSNPNYVDAHHSYGVVLALTRSYAKAAAELQTAVRMAPERAQAHLDLADVLAALGRIDEAAREFTIAANGNDAAAREAAQAGLRALGR